MRQRRDESFEQQLVLKNVATEHSIFYAVACRLNQAMVKTRSNHRPGNIRIQPHSNCMRIGAYPLARRSTVGLATISRYSTARFEAVN